MLQDPQTTITDGPRACRGRSRGDLPLACLLALALVGCESGGGPGGSDARPLPDEPEDPASPTDAPGVLDTVSRDADTSDGWTEFPPDPVPADEGAADAPSTDVSQDEEGGTDPGVPDPGPTLDPGTPAQAFCRAFADCGPDEVCDFSLGRCDPRDSWKTGRPALYAFHPPAGGAGDILVIDGSTFYTNLFSGQFNVRADIGGRLVAGGAGNIGTDENRLIGRIPAGVSGTIRVVFADGGGTRTFTESFQAAPAGVLPCDATTPGQGPAGSSPTTTGPYGAGYLDTDLHLTRVFYPAECGSIRRPGVSGVRPLVVVLHGNGALHLQHEHIAQLLATWGFVVVIPSTEATNDWSTEATRQVREVVDRFRDQADLGSLHPALAGVGTTARFVFLCHSRGCGRTEETLADHPSLRPHVAGAVFLGPHDRDLPVPGAFLVFGAARDGQSLKSFTDNAYGRQESPKWKVWLPGGNHGNFCDHKVYSMMDGQPTISRHQQLEVVQTFTVPFLQRVFGLDEPFARWLDQPPASSLYTVESTP